MGNSVDRKNAIRLYLIGTIGQITVIAVIVYLLRNSPKAGALETAESWAEIVKCVKV